MSKELKDKIDYAFNYWNGFKGEKQQGIAYGINLVREWLEPLPSDGEGEAVKELKEEIERLKSLLREVCIRANIILPERDTELDQFDEQFADQYDLIINIGATLGLGELDESDTEKNKKQLLIIQEQFIQNNKL